MTEQDTTAPENPHRGVRQRQQFALTSGPLEVDVIADWLVIYDKDEADGRIFHTAYLAGDRDSGRPVIFCMNGGPGGASVFLHFACVGPRALARDSAGKLDTQARDLASNPDSWLNFADLVFIDPIGTGFSHRISRKPEAGEEKKSAEKEAEKNPYWGTKKDLDSIGQFMRRFLRQHRLWRRPLYFAGESYGGYRAGRLAKLLNKEYGLGMAGIISISPIWQFRDVSDSDYSASQWVNQLPVYAAIAHRNGIGRAFAADTPMDEVLRAAEQFSIGDYVQMLVAGELMPEERRQAILARVADLIGLDTEFVGKANGRILIGDYARMVRKLHGEITDLYDGSLYSLDPFPHRTNNETAINEALFNDHHLYQNAVHQWFFEELGVETPLEYQILNHEAFENWKYDEKKFDMFEMASSMDDFRAGMTGNPHQRALIVHGRFDTVTPYFASRRLLHQASLAASVRARISEKLYDGGHMFYSWPEINREFAGDVEAFVTPPDAA
ncbi:S10 family serine carboxypeptidase-like protein [Haliea sp. E17]|uniref:S10 family serine carboxypeptidase-like protein n=1 Tax=Haliea sp. E17 TaxID=3401576 RepID=UPI003AAC7945